MTNTGVLLRDEDEVRRLERLAGATFHPKFTLSPEVLERFGLSGVTTMLQPNNWSTVIGADEETYEGLTIEFLSTLRFRTDHLGPVRFRLLGEWYERDCEFFSQAFGARRNGALSINDMSVQQFWESISDGNSIFQSGRVTVSKIQNPEIKAVHYILARTIFCRAESPEKINNQDIAALWSIARRKRVNVGYLWKEIVSHRLEAKVKKITQGPYVTLIARRLGILQNVREAPRQPRLIRVLQESDLVRWGFTPINNPRRQPNIMGDDSDEEAEIDALERGAPGSYQAGESSGAGPSNVDPLQAERGRRRQRDHQDPFDFGAFDARLTHIEQGQAALRQSVDGLIATQEARFTQQEERWQLADERYDQMRSWLDWQRNQWEAQQEFQRRVDRYMQRFPPPDDPQQ